MTYLTAQDKRLLCRDFHVLRNFAWGVIALRGDLGK